MTFTFGMAAVYMWNGLSIAGSEVPVNLPKATSTDMFVVFPDNRWVLTRAENCDKDPRAPQARIDCTNERLFENRDMRLYAEYEITCDASKSDNYISICGSAEEKKQRSLIWQHWRNKTRAHIVVRKVGDGWSAEDHYFVEPDEHGNWQIAQKEKWVGFRVIDDKKTEVEVIDDRSTIKRIRWTVAPEDNTDWMTPGTRYLEIIEPDGPYLFM